MNILFICGSLRKESLNRKLMQIAMRHATGLGATVTEAHIADLPLYNEELEVDPWPPAAKRFYDEVASADAIVIVSPEYNFSVPGGLKNALDWASTGGDAFKGKTVAVMGASPGVSGTTKMQMHLRQALLGTGTAYVVPQPQVAVGSALSAFSEDGSLLDRNTDGRIAELLSNLIDMAQRMSR